MATRNDAKVGQPLTLQAQFKLASTDIDVSSVTRVELVQGDRILHTISAPGVSHVGTGLYEVTFTNIVEGGEFSDHWHYIAVANAATDVLALDVTISPVEGEQGEGPTPPPEPDIGSAHMCRITHRFLFAQGDGIHGVYVRFSPNTAVDRLYALGMIVCDDSSAVSDENGELVLDLIRGLRGTLSISGAGIVREVTIPGVATIDLLELVSQSDDLLEIQRPGYYVLPRRS